MHIVHVLNIQYIFTSKIRDPQLPHTLPSVMNSSLSMERIPLSRVHFKPAEL